VSNLLFFRRSLAYRNAAVEAMRKARAMPPGPERRATRRFARALGDLAKTEAWLEGQTPRLRSAAWQRQQPRSAATDRAVARPAGPAITFQRGLNRAAGGVDGTLAVHHMSSGYENRWPDGTKGRCCRDVTDANHHSSGIAAKQPN